MGVRDTICHQERHHLPVGDAVLAQKKVLGAIHQQMILVWRGVRLEKLGHAAGTVDWILAVPRM